jgi:hypothetical protein
MEPEAEKFWSDFERETGEQVEARSIGTWYEGGKDDNGVWGLVILTNASFRFKYLASENWFSSIFKSGRRGPARVIEDIVVPREELVELIEAQRGLLSRIFGSAFPRFALSWRQGGSLRREAFAIDPSTKLLPLLRELLPADRGQGGH